MRVVVSLTTIPSRLKYLESILKVIKNQTIQPDITYLNLPYHSKKEDVDYTLPPQQLLDKYNVQIIRCEDLGPITKLVPVLEREEDPDTIIITMDDDMEYTNDRIEQLLNTSAKLPNCAISGDGWIVGSWYNYLTYIINPSKDLAVDIIQGCSACLYKRKFFGDASELLDYPLEVKKYAFIHDDVWISGYLALRGVDRIVQSDYKKHINRQIANINALSSKISFYYRIVRVIYYFKGKGVFNELTPLSLRSVGIWIIIVLIILIIMLFIIKMTPR